MTEYICKECGEKYGRFIPGVETYHEGKCELCGKVASLCHVRRYSYLHKKRGGR
jgi:DNA-directed RNA polymerase subunit RPC12/RpoP